MRDVCKREREIKSIRDGGDAVLKTNQAAEYSGRIADDGCEHTNNGKRAEETEPAAPNVRRRHERERYLPREREHVREVVEESGRGHVTTVHHHGLLNLRLPVLFNHTDSVQIGVHQVRHFAGNVLQI